MNQEFTVKEFAAKERVTIRTVRHWITKGAVDIRRTPGGGIRIVERRVADRVTFSELRGSSST